MREIKFRAYWKPKNQEWTAEEFQEKPRMIYFDSIGYCDEYNHLSFRLSNASRRADGGGYNNLGADIDDMTVMQYTGLKDKNGVEIYESDIVKIHIGHEEWLDKSMIVEWIDGAFCLHIPGREKVTSLIFYADGVQVRRGHRNIGQFIEVIGNIYEHPQLTEAK